MKLTLLMFCFLVVFSANAANVAMVKIIKGEVDILTMGKTKRLVVSDWVEQGAVIKTGEKSFVKLLFIDKSQMNVGPNSEMKIESFSGKDSGVIDLVKGKIRSQVTKDYLQIQDKDKSKLFIKTHNAVMGVRGTDFIISTNGKNTSTILFEGEIVFNKLSEKGDLPSNRLEEIVDKGVRMFPGEFSVMEINRPLPTVPSLLNIEQKERLEKNQDFESDRSPGNSKGDSVNKSVVPEGLSGQLVGNNTDILKTEVAQTGAEAVVVKETPSSADPEGYVKGNLVKPANGSFVHVESGVIIPPGPKAVLDGNTNTYIAGADAGSTASDGSYIPPKNVEITNDGVVLVAVQTDTGVVVKEVAAPVPTVSVGSTSMANIGEPLPLPLPTGGTTTTNTYNTGTAPSGSLSGNDPSRVISGAGGTSGTNVSGNFGNGTTIIVNPP